MGYTAIFGGTFNPFHIGHFGMLEALDKSSIIDEILVVPAKVPPHKDVVFSISDSDRIEMCKIICEQFKKADLCLLEFKREGKSYTIDTVLQLEQKYNDKNFGVVCGGDLLAGLHTWYKFSQLCEHVTFLTFKRQGIEDFDYHINRLRNLGAKFEIFDNEIQAVSSTEFRESLNNDLLPKEIGDFIKSRGLYVE